MGNGTFPACGVRHARVLYKPWWKRSRLQEKQLMVSPLVILFLLKNAPNCTSEHPYFQNFLRGGGGKPPDPPSERRLRGKPLRARCASPTKRTTLKHFLDPPLFTASGDSRCCRQLCSTVFGLTCGQAPPSLRPLMSLM